MKQAVSILAVFLSLTTAAQQSGFPIKNELPVYKPVKFDLHKSFKSSKEVHVMDHSKETTPFSFDKPNTKTPGFKTLQDNLKDDRQIFQLEKRKNEWTDFSSGILHSYSRQRWFENKNNEQQRWMVQKMKRK